MNSIYCDIFYHKSITPSPIPPHFPLIKKGISRSPDFELLLGTAVPSINSSALKNLCVLDTTRVDEFLDHTG